MDWGERCILATESQDAVHHHPVHGPHGWTGIDAPLHADTALMDSDDLGQRCMPGWLHSERCAVVHWLCALAQGLDRWLPAACSFGREAWLGMQPACTRRGRINAGKLMSNQ